MCLDTTDSRRLLVLYDFFALLCLFSPQYYEKTIECFNYYKMVKREPVIFFNLVQTLRNAVSKEVAIKNLTLVNAIISTPEDLDLRSTQRTAFLRQGLREVLVAVQQRLEDELFNLQFNLFCDDEKEDQHQLKEVMGVNAGGTGEVYDESGLVQRLISSTKDSDVLSAAFQSILETLCGFPTDPKQKTTGQMWSLAVALLQQVLAGSIRGEGDTGLDTTALLQQMDFRAELAIKEKDFRAIEQELRTQLKKAQSDLSDAKQELSFVRERSGTSLGSNVVSTPLMRPKDKQFEAMANSSSTLPQLSEEERLAKHRLQEEEVFRLKQQLSESGIQDSVKVELEASKRKAESEIREAREESARLAAQVVQLKVCIADCSFVLFFVFFLFLFLFLKNVSLGVVGRC